MVPVLAACSVPSPVCVCLQESQSTGLLSTAPGNTNPERFSPRPTTGFGKEIEFAEKYNLAMTLPTASTLYHLILPTIFLNPVLFLHGLNTVLTKLLPTMNGHEGNSAQPHLDIHASESLCWGYTALIVWAQMVAFLRFDRQREEQEMTRLRKQQGRQQRRREDSGYG